MIMRNVLISVFAIGASVALAAQAPIPVKAPATYDATSEVTYGGVLTGVVAANSADGAVGVHLNLATGKGTLKVHLGPAIFVGMNDFYFVADDQVLITGAFVAHNGEVALWARTITKNGKTLTLRSPDGTPRWPFATAEDPDGCGIPHAPIRY